MNQIDQSEWQTQVLAATAENWLFANVSVCAQGILSGRAEDKSTHWQTIVVAQQPELTWVVGVRFLMYQATY